MTPPAQLRLLVVFCILFLLLAPAAQAADEDVTIFRPIGTPTKEEVEREFLDNVKSIREAQENTLLAAPGQIKNIVASSQLKLGTFSKRGVESVSEWLATLKLTRGNLLCTATMIGPRVLLTAAHCLNGVSEARLHVDIDRGIPWEDITFGVEHYNFKEIGANCEQHPSYRPYGFWRGFDYGLCLMTEDMPNKVWVREQVARSTFKEILRKLTGDTCQDLPVNRRHYPEDPPSEIFDELTQGIVDTKICVNPVFENLSLDPRHSRIRFFDPRSRFVLMSGFGCSDREQSDPDGNLRADFIEISQNMGFRMRLGRHSDSTSAFLCAGDSGGAAYRVFTEDPFGPRVVIGINSENTIINNRVGNVSFIVKTTSPAFRRFFQGWMRRNGTPRVCGINGYTERCRPLEGR